MIRSLCDQFETQEMAYQVVLASTSYALIKRLLALPEVKQAQKQLAENRELLTAVFKRAKELYSVSGTPGYMHPNDAFIAVYLILMNKSSDFRVQQFMQTVRNENKPQFRASRWVAQYIIEQTPSTTVRTRLSNNGLFDAFSQSRNARPKLVNV